MNEETPIADAKPIRLTKGQTEMLLNALTAGPKSEFESDLTDTQFIRLRLGGKSPSKSGSASSVNVYV